MKNLMRFDANVQEAFGNDQEKFNQFQNLMKDCANKTVVEYSVKEANDKIVEKFRESLGIEPGDKPQMVKRIFRAKHDMAFAIIEEVLEEMIITGWMNNPFFMKYVEVKNLALDDENDFYVEDDSILSVSRVSGNHHNLIRQRLGAGRHFSVAGQWYGIKIYSEFERLLTGAEDWASFVTKVTDAINRYMLDAVYASFKDAKTKLGTNWVQTGELQTQNVDKLIKLCQDVEMATGKRVTIFGAKAAIAKLNKLTPVEYYSDAMKDELHRNGILGTWEGFEVAEIGQGLKRGANINSASVEYMLDTDVLYIMPAADNKFIKVVNYGEAQVHEITDKDINRDMSNEYEVLYKMGINVVLNTVFGVWNIRGE